jgi:hypothetical protein
MPSTRTWRALTTWINSRSSCSSESGIRGRKPFASQRSAGGIFVSAHSWRWYTSRKNVRSLASNSANVSVGFPRIAPPAGGVHREEYAVSRDGMKFYGVLDLETTFNGCRFSIGIRNSHDKTMRLSLICGYRVAVCENGMFSGDFQPVSAKHSKNFNLIDSLEVGVANMQRNFEPMIKAVDLWRGTQITDVTAKLLIYEAFVEAATDFPKHLAKDVHKNYFQPEYEEFQPRTVFSLSNAFTSAFKQLDPIPQYRATAELATFLETRSLA